MTRANEVQVAGTHYRAKLQHWDYAVQALDNRYLEGNLTKYVTRHRKKNGLQDLDKAMHYLMKLIEEVTAGRVHPMLDGCEFDVHEFSVSNGLNSAEDFIVKRMARWTRLQHLHQVRVNIEILRKAAIEDQNTLDGLKAGAGYVNQDR